ncbi:putative DNA-invertase from lambdoid prophage Rac [Ensifer sp. M14]|uniref:recombinase family protein n=1 Tax=Ensifer sp. M14 TaxID=2203782 RepID=UPI000E1D247B|nr:recombinase family protein [Ensifer sp. M14]RDL50152.1 putative DNA-invertase from lambdoid prophage Rac [Ensifer sp. M14]
MSRTFAYCRVSTTEQSTENQILEITNKGFVIEPHRIVAETISGSTPAKERPGFQKLLERMERGDRLIITKIDRLGRDSIDVQSTLVDLTEAGIEVHCIALAGFDLGSAMGGLVMKVFAAVAQFERELLIERTHAGLARARAEGKTLGRPKSLTDQQKDEARQAVKEGASYRSVAKSMGVSHATIMRVCEAI